jgi:ribosome assembly protein YihI (activator of Der GTPase)
MCLSRNVYNNATFEDQKYFDELKDMIQRLEEQMKIEIEETDEVEPVYQ